MSQTNKTVPTSESVSEYIQSIADTAKQKDALVLIDIMKKATKEDPVMWGPSIVGFGIYHYKYASGREGDTPRVAFSARKQALTIYGLIFYDKMHKNNELLVKLGPHKKGKGCLYIKSLSLINLGILNEMIMSANSTQNPQ